jgi:hypothetical protein
MNDHDRESRAALAHQLAEQLAREAPSRARPGLIDEVLAQTTITPQLDRRAWWPVVAWPGSRFARPLQIALAGILVVVVGSGLAVVGGHLADRGSLVGASPEPTPRLAPADAWPPLEPGVPYYIDAPVRVTFSVPAGWTYSFTNPAGSVVINEQQTAAVGWYVTTNLFADPCHWQEGPLDPPVGPSVDDLVAALKRLPGFIVTGPSPSTIGGLPAQSLTVVLTVSPADCDQSQMKVWSEMPTGGRDTYWGTSTVRVLDVGGTRLMVISTPLPDSADMTADIDAIVRSMRFE